MDLSGVYHAIVLFMTAALFPRSEAAATESNSNLTSIFRPDAPQGTLDLMAQHIHQPG